MDYESIMVTTVISLLIVCGGVFLADVIGQWLWRDDELLPPPEDATRREVYDAWKHD
jgi:hypothetical protein